MATPNARRRQRSTRITVAAALIAIATLAVIGAVVGGSVLVISLAAFVAVGLGAAATKIMHSELLASRRENARDRAEQAQAYRTMEAERVAENQAFARAMTERIEERQLLIGDLEVELANTQRKVAETTLKLGAEARRAGQAEARVSQETRRAEVAEERANEADERAAEAIVRVAELEQELELLRTELDAWQAMANEPRRQHA